MYIIFGTDAQLTSYKICSFFKLGNGRRYLGNTSNGNNRTVQKVQVNFLVIVKFYDLEEGVLSLNDSVEFVGILSTDPLVARAGFEDSAMMSAEGASVELDFVAQV